MPFVLTETIITQICCACQLYGAFCSAFLCFDLMVWFGSHQQQQLFSVKMTEKVTVHYVLRSKQQHTLRDEVNHWQINRQKSLFRSL